MEGLIEDLKTGKVKLEFGNQEQIKAIDDHHEKNREGTYRIEISFSGGEIVEVDASSEDEAIEKAKDEVNLYDIELEVEGVEFLEDD